MEGGLGGGETADPVMSPAEDAQRALSSEGTAVLSAFSRHLSGANADTGTDSTTAVVLPADEPTAGDADAAADAAGAAGAAAEEKDYQERRTSLAGRTLRKLEEERAAQGTAVAADGENEKENQAEAAEAGAPDSAAAAPADAPADSAVEEVVVEVEDPHAAMRREIAAARLKARESAANLDRMRASSVTSHGAANSAAGLEGRKEGKPSLLREPSEDTIQRHLSEIQQSKTVRYAVAEQAVAEQAVAEQAGKEQGGAGEGKDDAHGGAGGGGEGGGEGDGAESESKTGAGGAEEVAEVAEVAAASSWITEGKTHR